MFTLHLTSRDHTQVTSLCQEGDQFTRLRNMILDLLGNSHEWTFWYLFISFAVYLKSQFLPPFLVNTHSPSSSLYHIYPLTKSQ